GSPEEQQMGRMFLQLLLALTAQRTVDEDVRVRWFRGPIGSEWARLAGPVATNGDMAHGDPGEDGGTLGSLDDAERRLLGRPTEGLPTAQIPARLGRGSDPAQPR